MLVRRGASTNERTTFKDCDLESRFGKSAGSGKAGNSSADDSNSVLPLRFDQCWNEVNLWGKCLECMQDGLDDTPSKNREFLSRTQTYTAVEHVIVTLRDLVQQALVNGDHHPQRRPAIVVD